MKFRQKSVVVEAMQWTGSIASAQAIIKWSSEVVGYESEQYGHPEESERNRLDWLRVSRNGRILKGQPNDWVVRSTKDEYYFMKPDEFAKTYEPA